MRILLVDDHEVVRLGTRSQLSRHPQFTVVAETNTAKDAIRLALETVARGEALLDPAVTKKVFDRVREAARKSEGEAFGRLSDRELQVLARLAEGSTNKAIAEKVFLSEKTVRNYVSSILTKLKLSTRSEAAYAVKHHVKDHLPTE